MSTWPRSVNLMPNPTKPRPSVKGLRPTATSTTSAFISSFLLPVTASTVTVAPFFVLLTAVTFDFNLNLNPCFFKILANVFEISLSISGIIQSINSTTVASEPRRFHTEPSSSPITPPPITTKWFGTFERLSAPVEDTIIFSSISMPGRSVTSDPVAITIFLVISVSVPPPLIFTSTLPELATEPRPLI